MLGLGLGFRVSTPVPVTKNYIHRGRVNGEGVKAGFLKREARVRVQSFISSACHRNIALLGLGCSVRLRVRISARVRISVRVYSNIRRNLRLPRTDQDKKRVRYQVWIRVRFLAAVASNRL